jgi:hypothetical protein
MESLPICPFHTAYYNTSYIFHYEIEPGFLLDTGIYFILIKRN